MRALTHYLAAQAVIRQQELLEEARRQRVTTPVRRRGGPVHAVLARLRLLRRG